MNLLKSLASVAALCTAVVLLTSCCLSRDPCCPQPCRPVCCPKPIACPPPCCPPQAYCPPQVYCPPQQYCPPACPQPCSPSNYYPQQQEYQY